MPMPPVGPYPAAHLVAGLAQRATQNPDIAAAGEHNQGAGTRSGRAASGEYLISLSPAGLQQAKAASKDNNRDIDESGLPDTLKELLKMARKLKEQLHDRTQSLQRLMADADLTAEERNLQAQRLQAEIGTLSGALATVMKQFAKAMKEADLSREQAAKVAELLAA